MYIPNHHTTPLSIEEERSVMEAAKRGNKKAIDRLILSNYRFVVQVAHQQRGRGVEVEDLISEGVLGLRKAIERYNPATGYKFISYAVWWVRAFMTRCIAYHGTTVRMPANFHVNPVGKPKALTEAHQEAIRQSRNGPSMEVMQENGFDLPHPGPSTDEQAWTRLTRERVAALLEGLDDIDRDILRSRYGLLTGESECLESIGERYGISKERIRQRQKHAEERIKRFHGKRTQLHN